MVKMQYSAWLVLSSKDRDFRTDFYHEVLIGPVFCQLNIYLCEMNGAYIRILPSF